MMTGKKTCFVVGPIGEAGSVVRRKADWLLKGIVRPVLETEEFGFVVKRADDDADPGSITNALINDVIHSDLVVADLTGFNPNAFYELGIRHAVQKPTIHIIAEAVRLPFDNLDQRTIFVDLDDFGSFERAKDQLRAAASTVAKDGYVVTNPVTRAGGIAALQESADPKDKILGDVLDRLSRLEHDKTALAIIGQGPYATMTKQQADRSIVDTLANFGYQPLVTERNRSLLEAANKVRSKAELDILRAAAIIQQDVDERESLASRLANIRPPKLGDSTDSE